MALRRGLLHERCGVGETGALSGLTKAVKTEDGAVLFGVGSGSSLWKKDLQWRDESAGSPF